jgi:hypothetical protein
LTLSLVLADGVFAATKEWDMSVGTPGDPTATWFQNALWTTTGVPTAADDVIFGGPLGIDNPTLVKFFSGDPGVGYPNAVANSLIANSAVSPTPSLSTLTLDMGDSLFPFAGNLTVGNGTFSLGTAFESTVNISSNLWNISHTSTTERLRVAQAGATAGISLINADLTVANRLDIARGFHYDTGSGTVTPSVGNVIINGNSLDRSLLSVGNLTVVGIDGGQGTLTIGADTDATFGDTVFVGLQNGSDPSAGIIKSQGTLDATENFASSPEVLFSKGLQVGILAAQGIASLLGNVTITPDSTNLAMMIGRGAADDSVNGIVVRGDGSVSVGGFSGDGVQATGNTFVGIDGGIGSIGFLPGGTELIGDLVIGDLGFNSAIDGYVASSGSAGIALGASVNVVGDIFIGNNNSFGIFTANPSGDGGSSLSAEYVSVGEQGTGDLIIANMITVTFNHLELKLASGPDAYQQGGTATLGGGSHPNSSLSVEFLSAQGEGNRFNWQSDRLVLRDGIIYDWGNNSLTVPVEGRLDGSGVIEADVVNLDTIDVGYYDGIPTIYNDSLSINGNSFLPGDYTQSADAELYLTASLPTRLSLNGEETLIVAGDASLAGTLFLYADTLTVDGSDYWYNNVLPGDTFLLLDVEGTTTGVFGNIPIGSALLPAGLPELPFFNASYSDYRWDTTQLYTTGIVVVSVIPEPATLASLLTASILLLRRRRPLR